MTGPDEYSAVKDNNIYTNLMAQRNLACAADLAVKLPDASEKLGVTTEEAASWRDAAQAMVIPYDEELGVHQQSEGFTQHQVERIRVSLLRDRGTAIDADNCSDRRVGEGNSVRL